MVKKVGALSVLCAGLTCTVVAADFRIGCNYWASNAGAYMWRRWDAKCVEADLDVLKGSGVNTLRVFPLWPDFQPITRVSTVMGWLYGYQQNDGPFQNEAGVDPVMVERFRFLCDAADKRGMKLIVGLVTGWMSGRMFVPPAFESKNVITDAGVIEWEVRFVRHFVRAMKDHAAIVAWDLGNECNCMGSKSEGTEIPITRADAWAWMNQIASAIRLEDRDRPVVSGMHSCPSEMSKPWSLRDQGELVDVLTTHPYPLFTPHCNKEPFDSFRNALHPVAESLYYAGVSGKPCFPEEVGGLGPNVAPEEKAAWTLRLGALASAAFGLKGYLWWCAFDQNELGFPPYEWLAVERELGLFRANREPKPMARMMGAVGREIAALGDLPKRKIDAVCLVSEMEDAWPQSFGAFLLSVQAGLSIEFASIERELPDAKVFILPAGDTSRTCTRTAWMRLCEKVRSGASLILSKGHNSRYTEFEALTGCRIESSCDADLSCRVVIPGVDRPVELSGAGEVIVSAVRAKTLLRDDSGRPFLTVSDYGKGKVVYINAPIERTVVERNDCFRETDTNPAYRVYALAADEIGVKRSCPGKSPFVCVTEQVEQCGEHRMVGINLSHVEVSVPFHIPAGGLGIGK